MYAPDRFTLTDDEHRDIPRQTGRQGFIAVVEWNAGPRGGAFRPMRARQRPTTTDAIRAIEAIIASRRAQAAKVTVFRVNASGRVLDSTVAA